MLYGCSNMPKVFQETCESLVRRGGLKDVAIQSCKTTSIVYVDHMVLQLANKLHIMILSMSY